MMKVDLYPTHMNFLNNANTFVLLENAITAFDFNPLGTLAAYIDELGVCIIADVDTNDYIFDIRGESEDG